MKMQKYKLIGFREVTGYSTSVGGLAQPLENDLIEDVDIDPALLAKVLKNNINKINYFDYLKEMYQMLSKVSDRKMPQFLQASLGNISTDCWWFQQDSSLQLVSVSPNGRFALVERFAFARENNSLLLSGDPQTFLILERTGSQKFRFLNQTISSQHPNSKLIGMPQITNTGYILAPYIFQAVSSNFSARQSQGREAIADPKRLLSENNAQILVSPHALAQRGSGGTSLSPYRLAESQELNVPPGVFPTISLFHYSESRIDHKMMSITKDRAEFTRKGDWLYSSVADVTPLFLTEEDEGLYREYFQ